MIKRFVVTMFIVAFVALAAFSGEDRGNAFE